MLEVELYTGDPVRQTALARLIDRYYREMHSELYVSDLNKCKNFINYQIRNGKEIWLLTNKGKPIGYGIICINNEYGMLPDSIEQEYLYVKKKYRKGVGAAMLVKVSLNGCRHHSLAATVPAFIDGEASKMAKSLGMKPELEIMHMSAKAASEAVDRLDRLIKRGLKNVAKKT